MFLDYFNELMSKIIKKIKNIYYFNIFSNKKYFKLLSLLQFQRSPEIRCEYINKCLFCTNYAHFRLLLTLSIPIITC
jgi:hypothetical protein